MGWRRASSTEHTPAHSCRHRWGLQAEGAKKDCTPSSRAAQAGVLAPGASPKLPLPSQQVGAVRACWDRACWDPGMLGPGAAPRAALHLRIPCRGPSPAGCSAWGERGSCRHGLLSRSGKGPRSDHVSWTPRATLSRGPAMLLGFTLALGTTGFCMKLGTGTGRFSCREAHLVGVRK